MPKWLFLLIIVIGTLSSNPAAQTQDGAALISPKEMRLAIKNIEVALKTTYLHPGRAKYIAQSLISDSFAKPFQHHWPVADFRAYLQRRLVKATLDTSIEVTERTSMVEYLADGTTRLKLPSGALNTMITDNNIGLLTITGDLTFELAQPLLEGAFNALAQVDALVIDISNADAANLAVITYMIGIFVEEGTVIGNLNLNKTVQPILAKTSQSEDNLHRNLPLYIINSSFVAGEWEFFSHALQQLGKATIIGQPTMGIGELTTAIEVADDINLSIPYATISIPLTGDTWQNVGVIPDVLIEQDRALDKAYALSHDKLQKARERKN